MNPFRFGPRAVPAAELSDAELENELSARRQRTGAPTTRRLADHEAARLYAQLEVPVGAPLDQVKRAYLQLSERYAPERHAGDARKQALAKELLARLSEAYRALSAFLEAKAR